VTCDFSTQGVYFETDLSLSVGEPLKFVIPMEHSDLGPSFRIRCQGEVVRVEPTVGKIGVAVVVHSYSFEGIDEREQA